MAKEKLVKNITPRDENFAQWYTDVVREAELCDLPLSLKDSLELKVVKIHFLPQSL